VPLTAGRPVPLSFGDIDGDQCYKSLLIYGLLSLQGFENQDPVHLKLTIRRLLAVLMIAGLALVPLSRPVMAGTSPHASMQAMADEMSAADPMDEMASDMPCCPSKAPATDDCDKCVFMAACMSIGFVGMSVAVFHPFRVASGAIALQRDDSRPDGLGHPPPEHPPRILV
jgi:hypothetical protein